MDFALLRKKEFSRLDALDQVYLDYTGSGLYSKWQIDEHHSFMNENALGNPHTFSPTSTRSTEYIESTRNEILRFFHASNREYEVIFTLNATQALKLVGESYPFSNRSRFVLTTDNHNSVNGIREYALGKRAKVVYVPLDFDLSTKALEAYLSPVVDGGKNLFAFPAQSNFAGTRYPLEWIDYAHSRGYDVLLDAAAFVSTNRLDLSKVKPEFVPVSFYKMFGYPTGVGVLLAKKSGLAKLSRPWFSGGTIDLVTTKHFSHHFLTGSRAFEDGTPNFLNIPAVTFGLRFLDRIGIDNIHKHVMELCIDLLGRLRSLSHSNGSRMVKVYGSNNIESMGSAIAFNMLTPSGRIVDSRVIGKLASENNISLRTGCFCNPGSGEHFFEYSEKDEEKCVKEVQRGDLNLEEFLDCVGGKAGGAVRVSLGIASDLNDIERLVHVLITLKDCHDDINECENLPKMSC